MATIDQVVNAVLYEGYVLWPYRRSAIKNRQRWTFGGVYPRAFSEANGGHDPWVMQTQCLVSGVAPTVSVRVRFLHVVDRQVLSRDEAGRYEPVDELTVDGERHLTWEEAIEREASLDDLHLPDLAAPREMTVDVPAGHRTEILSDRGGTEAGRVERCWEAIRAIARVSAKPLDGSLFRLTVGIENTSDWSGSDRDQVLRRTPVATHTILSVTDGEFLSLMDPPHAVKEAAAACRNLNTWPVMVGDEGETDTMLSSPIILYDYPQIAPESPGDLYDSTEIDQLLVLNILSLTDEEKAEMRATDSRAREILERTESLTADDFMNLHGATREFRKLGEEWDFPTLTEPSTGTDTLGELESPPPERLLIGDVPVEKGSRVVLRPSPGGDVFDLTLAGKVAIVEDIEQDYEGQLFLAVTVEDDPGRELGQQRFIGHRFFFKPEEVETVAPSSTEGTV